MSNKMTPASQAEKAKADFNAFLGKAASRGELRVQNVRVHSRQPESEAFCRKAAVAVRRLVPGTKISMESIEVSAVSAKSGTVELGAAAAQMMASTPKLTPYLEPKPVPKSARKPAPAPDLELFGILHSFAAFEAAKRFAAAPALQTGGVSVVGLTSGAEGRVDAKVMGAADSVYAQSFADVHAIALRAAVDGPQAALQDLEAVMEARKASGDFTTYTLAPLSHDSLAALSILRGQLKAGVDFTAMSSDELFQNSQLVAREGLAAWMQSHGAEYRVASSLSNGLEAMVDVAAAASMKMDPYARPTMRPH